MKLLDYDFWKDLATVMSYATVGFSIIGRETFGASFNLFIASAMLLIFFCIIQMFLHKISERK